MFCGRFCGFASHNQRAKCWRQRQGVKQRDSHSNSHCQSELRIEGTSHAANKANGHEDGHEYQRRCHQCRRDAVHSLDGSMIRDISFLLPLSSFLTIKLRLYGLHHHDGIVDHRTDDQHQSKQRQHVQRETNGIDDSKGGYQRYHDGDTWNDSGSPTAQE